MALKDRVARLEASDKINPHLSAAAWWSELLARPKDNEHRINAAFFLASDGIVEKPPAHQWKALEKATQCEAGEAPDSLLAFCSFYTLGFRDDEEEEQDIRHSFAADDGKEWLCLMATVFWDVFKTAPLVPLPEIEKHGAGRRRVVHLGELRTNFIRPLYELIFPDGCDSPYWKLEEWLDRDLAVESLLKDLRAYMSGPGAKNLHGEKAA